eukprot:983732-Prymnesium_polylepis.1
MPPRAAPSIDRCHPVAFVPPCTENIPSGPRRHTRTAAHATGGHRGVQGDEGLTRIVREVPARVERIEVRWGDAGWERRLGQKRPREEAAAEPLQMDDCEVEEEEPTSRGAQHKVARAAGGADAQCRVKVEGAA